ncbi:MAG: peptide chain release factor N(5)-glutamine methyltransferase [Alphaproteobacteria bacterium]|nr:peptide chain release factor N(5)-glutamine methyltransferase [Alphaproteobacteria bacterium]
MPEINDALRMAAAQLLDAGVEQARLDARLLLAAVTGLSHEEMIRDPAAELSPEHVAAYGGVIARRAAREPVSRIVGRREFWSLEFEITSDTLDPRPDSETLIGAVLSMVKDRGQVLRILDVGVGSGCLLLALLSEYPQAYGMGIDISQGALDVARRNAERLGLCRRAHFLRCDVRRADWAGQVRGPFDLVIANPPYIRTADITVLAPEVSRFDPLAALAGGEDGLDFYRMITNSMAQLLCPDGLAVFEAGAGQAEAVQMLLQQAGLAGLDPHYDLGGVARAVIGRFEA